MYWLSDLPGDTNPVDETWTSKKDTIECTFTLVRDMWLSFSMDFLYL